MDLYLTEEESFFFACCIFLKLILRIVLQNENNVIEF